MQTTIFAELSPPLSVGRFIERLTGLGWTLRGLEERIRTVSESPGAAVFAIDGVNSATFLFGALCTQSAMDSAEAEVTRLLEQSSTASAGLILSTRGKLEDQLWMRSNERIGSRP